MGAARNKISFIIIGVLAAFVLALFFQPLAADCVSVSGERLGDKAVSCCGGRR